MIAKEKVSVLDVDGVVYNYVDNLAKVAAAYTGRPLSDFPPANVWNFFSDQWGMTLKEYLALVDIGVDMYGFISTGAPYENSVEGINALLNAGVGIHIATDLGDDNDTKGHRRARIAWLDSIGVDLSKVKVTFTHDKAAVASGYLVEGYDVYSLEDKTENFISLRDAGVNSYLRSQNWNKDADGPRVNSVLEFANIITSTGL